MAPRAVTALARRTMCASSASTCLKTRAKIKLNQMKGEIHKKYIATVVYAHYKY